MGDIRQEAIESEERNPVQIRQRRGGKFLCFVFGEPRRSIDVSNSPRAKAPTPIESENQVEVK